MTRAEAEAACAELGQLVAGWDSYGGRPTDPVVLGVVPDLVDVAGLLTTGQLYPLGTGGVLFEASDDRVVTVQWVRPSDAPDRGTTFRLTCGDQEWWIERRR